MLVVILSGSLPVLQEQFIFMVESVLHWTLVLIANMEGKHITLYKYLSINATGVCTTIRATGF